MHIDLLLYSEQISAAVLGLFQIINLVVSTGIFVAAPLISEYSPVSIIDPMRDTCDQTVLFLVSIRRAGPA